MVADWLLERMTKTIESYARLDGRHPTPLCVAARVHGDEATAIETELFDTRPYF